MNQKRFMTNKDVVNELGVSTSKAYTVMKELNRQLEEKGFMTIPGKVSRAYFEEKFYGHTKEELNAELQG